MLFLHQPISDVPMITAPFTMTGTLNLFDPLTNDPVVVDLIGQGTIQCCRTPDPLGSSFQLVAVEFNFEPGPTSVPEPSSLSLLAGAFWPLLVVAMRKKFKG
jgi:hypothetical protein